eukprot:TRINITY_DN2209_c0_g1_i2.p1 TRINITY_DN2209_c0_g1~~TRINITY_DN2209_c0_g1_i2.p1  ORF type:complete len:422 (+),score=42.54 TRINITY_DN2209_c0_g1_i2:93-1268(+)
MSSKLHLLTCLYLLFAFYSPASGTKVHSLFLFGDSYLDTGNLRKLTNYPPDPYGQTFPGQTTGRFSDGVVFTDVLAAYLRVRPEPTPFTFLNQSAPVVPRSGLNFAIAGAGINAGGPKTNLAAQVDAFAGLVLAKVIPAKQVRNSLFVLSVGGNDYLNLLINGTRLDAAFVSQYAPQLLNGTWEQLSRLLALGAKRFAILTLPPGQCSPRATIIINNVQCLSADLVNITFHNDGLKAIRERLVNAGASAGILDIYSAALYVIQNPTCFGVAPSTALKSCCFGLVSNELGQFGCGAYNLTTFQPLFTVCPSPATAFFWDGVHPSNAAWKAISSLIFYGSGYTTPALNLCKSIDVECRKPPRKNKYPGSAPIRNYCAVPFKDFGRHRNRRALK